MIVVASKSTNAPTVSAMTTSISGGITPGLSVGVGGARVCARPVVLCYPVGIDVCDIRPKEFAEQIAIDELRPVHAGCRGFGPLTDHC